MLILFHGGILLIFPAACCLFIAALSFTYLWRSKRAARESFFVTLAMFLGTIFGILGLLLLAGFLDEFRYFVKYNF
jgi:hypothetical protein